MGNLNLPTLSAREQRTAPDLVCPPPPSPSHPGSPPRLGEQHHFGCGAFCGARWDPLRHPGPVAPLGTAGAPRTPRSAGAHLQRTHTNPPSSGKAAPLLPKEHKFGLCRFARAEAGMELGVVFLQLWWLFFPREFARLFQSPAPAGLEAAELRGTSSHTGGFARQEHLRGETHSLETVP